MELYAAIIESDFSAAQQSLQLVERCVQQYGLQHVALSFNGGKDCTVLLHLLRAALAHLQLPLSELLVLYFHEPAAFPEMLSFLHSTAQRYQLRTLTLHGPYRDALAQLFASHPTRLEAIFMGQRRCDPSGPSLSLVTPSSPEYPRFLRINPLLQWSYADVWRALRDWRLEYCSLYDRGFTSIGSSSNSRPNARLWDEQTQSWRGAWTLLDGDDERGGRQSDAAAAATGQPPTGNASESVAASKAETPP